MNKTRKLQLNQRSNKGIGGITIIILVLVAIIIGLAIFAVQIEIAMFGSQKAQHATESAAVAAATNLSKIMIQDPKLGYVSLTDYPAVSKFTAAADGEPLPVFGINSLIAGSRIEMLLADELKSQAFRTEAERDRDLTNEAARNLESTLSKSCSNQLICHDFYGAKVSPYDQAREIFLANMPVLSGTKARLSKLELKLGWLENGSSTVQAMPERAGALPKEKKDFVKSFLNQAAAGQSYTFAGTSEQAHIVDVSRFRPADDKHISSVVKVDSTIDFLDHAGKIVYTINSSAAAIPYAQADQSAAGSLVVYFSEGTINRWNNLRSMIEDPALASANITAGIARGGDFPVDPEAVFENTKNSSASVMLARAIQDWVRTNHGRSSLSALIAALDKPFNEDSSSAVRAQALIYDFDAAGNCVTKNLTDCGFLNKTISDSQIAGTAQGLGRTERGELCLLIRDMVHDISPRGGKHSGQPIPGELPAKYCSPSSIMDAAADELSTEASTKCRKSYLKGGLAVAIEVFHK